MSFSLRKTRYYVPNRFHLSIPALNHHLTAFNLIFYSSFFCTSSLAITTSFGASMPILICPLLIFSTEILILSPIIKLSPNLLVSTSICNPPWFCFMGYDLCVISLFSFDNDKLTYGEGAPVDSPLVCSEWLGRFDFGST